MALPAEEQAPVLRTSDFERVRRMIYAHAGIALSAQKHEMVYGRLNRRLRVLGMHDFTRYLDWLEGNLQAPEWEHFINALTTNLTSFFREPYHFEALAQFARTRGNLDIWCCAASTGEEPYSIAITVAEALGSRHGIILATDIDTHVLEVAREAVYPFERVKMLPPERLHRYFLCGTGPNSGKVKVVPELRNMVKFETLNLNEPRWPLLGARRFDAVFCRNVMIYFDRATQRTLVAHIATHMQPGGLLFIGHSENLNGIAPNFVLRGKTVYEMQAD